MDSDDRPALNAAGLLARYTNGTWRTECLESVPRDNDTQTARMGERVCRYLGFRYETFKSFAHNCLSVVTIEMNE